MFEFLFGFLAGVLLVLIVLWFIGNILAKENPQVAEAVDKAAEYTFDKYLR